MSLTHCAWRGAQDVSQNRGCRIIADRKRQVSHGKSVLDIVSVFGLGANGRSAGKQQGTTEAAGPQKSWEIVSDVSCKYCNVYNNAMICSDAVLHWVLIKSAAAEI